LRREGISSIINPLDKHAIEQALYLKEKSGGRVTVISMAPPSSISNLREAMAMGADDAVLLSDRAFAGADTLATAYVLAAGIRELGKFDLILCGKHSLDGYTGQVGPQIAEFLGIPHVTNVRKANLAGQGLLQVESAVEDGHFLMEAQIPILLTVTEEINTPRHISLMKICEVMSKEVKIWTMKDIDVDKNLVGLLGSPTQVVDVFMPEMERRGEVLKGDTETVVTLLVEKLRRLGVI
jgi:electron transfer flavoprotein beta subunit